MKINVTGLAIICFPLIILLTSCTKDSLQRSAYLTMKNYNEQQCKKDMNADCPTQHDYDKYQQELEKLNTPSGY